MNYAVVFSTYNNKTKKTGGLKDLEQFLAGYCKDAGIQGFSLQDQLGYWAGEYEKSYILTLFDISKDQAFKMAAAINARYNQEASIVKRVSEQVYFINNEDWRA